MNIFYLSNDPKECAAQHVDKHVVKMILEYAQLLSNAHHMLDGEQVITPIYKLTHKNHPSAIWVRKRETHYRWLFNLWCALLEEYTYRYNKTHASSRLLPYLCTPPKNIVYEGKFDEPTLAMPDEYKTDSVIESYRNYYRGAKSAFANWKMRDTPAWFYK